MIWSRLALGAHYPTDLAGGVLHIEDILKAGGSNALASAWLNLARLYLEVAQGERVLLIDADLQDPPELLPEMMAAP